MCVCVCVVFSRVRIKTGSYVIQRSISTIMFAGFIGLEVTGKQMLLLHRCDFFICWYKDLKFSVLKRVN